MTDHEQVVNEQFELHRPHLAAVAYRMLGSAADADDAVQETWLRLNRTEASGLHNIGGWLTTVIGRVCLDMLRSRKAHGEVRAEPMCSTGPEAMAAEPGPEEQAMLADSVSLALLVVIENLAPAERLAFVLHDMFDLPFSDIAPIVDRSPNAAAQLASRARRRIRGKAPASLADLREQRHVVEAFLSAARGGNFDDLIAVLDTKVVLEVDAAAAYPGQPSTVVGANAVAAGSGTFAGFARSAEAVVIDGAVGLIVAPTGRLRHVLIFAISGRKITRIAVVGSRDRLNNMVIGLVDKIEHESKP